MVYNKKLGILPATGGSGILFYLFVGGGIAAIALVLMRKTKKAATAA
jgi:LPXTG-motif cell wall-anchored protein